MVKVHDAMQVTEPVKTSQPVYVSMPKRTRCSRQDVRELGRDQFSIVTRE